MKTVTGKAVPRHCEGVARSNPMKVLFIYMVLFATSLCAVSNVPPDGETLTRSSAAGEDVAELVPEGTPLREVLSDIPSGKDGFAVASVSFVPCQRWLSAAEGGVSKPPRQKIVTELYNALMSVSTQKGITYISRREGMKPKVLFDESYFIQGEYRKGGDITAISDPVVDVPPANEVRYAYQADSSFGGNVYRYDITCDGQVINAHITNETPMKYHGVTCLKAGELSMFVQISPRYAATDEGGYSGTAPAAGGAVVNTAAIVTGHKSKIRVLMISVDLSSSFARRTRALHDWYRALIAQ